MINKKAINVGFAVAATVLLLVWMGAMIYLTFFIETDIMKASVSIDELEEMAGCRSTIHSILADEYYRGDNSIFSSKSPYRALSNIYPGPERTRYQYFDNIKDLNEYFSSTEIFSAGEIKGGIVKGNAPSVVGAAGEEGINCHTSMYGVVNEKLLVSRGIDKIKAYLVVGYKYD